MRPKQTTQNGLRSFAAIRAPHAAGQARDKLASEEAEIESDIPAKNSEKSVAAAVGQERRARAWAAPIADTEKLAEKKLSRLAEADLKIFPPADNK